MSIPVCVHHHALLFPPYINVWYFVSFVTTNTGTSSAQYKRNCRQMWKDMENFMLDLDIESDEFDFDNDGLLVETVDGNINNNVTIVRVRVIQSQTLKALYGAMML